MNNELGDVWWMDGVRMHPAQLSKPLCGVCDSAYDPEAGDSWGGMCPDCSEEHFICENCKETLHSEEYGEDGLCLDCVLCHGWTVAD